MPGSGGSLQESSLSKVACAGAPQPGVKRTVHGPLTGLGGGAGQLDIVLVNLLIMSAAILGDSTGFLLGWQTGPKIFSRPDSRFFKQEYVTRTHAFYERY